MSACVDSLSLALGQISFAVNDLTKKNYKATLKEINEVSFQMKVVILSIKIVYRFNSSENGCTAEVHGPDQI